MLPSLSKLPFTCFPSNSSEYVPELSAKLFRLPHVYCSSSVALVTSFTRFDFSFASIVDREDLLGRTASDASRMIRKTRICDYDYRREQDAAKQGDFRRFISLSA